MSGTYEKLWLLSQSLKKNIKRYKQKDFIKIHELFFSVFVFYSMGK